MVVILLTSIVSVHKNVRNVKGASLDKSRIKIRPFIYFSIVLMAWFGPTRNFAIAIRKQRGISVNLTVAKKKELNLQKRFILLDDPFISMIGSDFTQGEVSPHLCPLPPRERDILGIFSHRGEEMIGEYSLTLPIPGRNI